MAEGIAPWAPASLVSNARRGSTCTILVAPETPCGKATPCSNAQHREALAKFQESQ